MKKLLSFFALAVMLAGCDKELVKKPDNLIDKKVMGDILYDMALLDALRYQDANTLYDNGVNPKTYILKKYKVTEAQFTKSNAYYASDYREYKKMYDNLSDRLKREKESYEALVKKAEKKETALKKAKEKKEQDSIKKAKKAKEFKLKRDSIAKIKSSTELKVKKSADPNKKK